MISCPQLRTSPGSLNMENRPSIPMGIETRKGTFTICLLHVAQSTFANSLDPHQARQSVGPDLDQNRLVVDGIPEINFRKKRF